MNFQRLALIGCGLMGGSFALALRQAGLVQHITGFSASEKTRQRAVELRVIDQACSSVAEAVLGADLVLLAVPVGAMHSSFVALRNSLSPTALLMDVGSTKCDVIAAAKASLGYGIIGRTINEPCKPSEKDRSDRRWRIWSGHI